LKANFSVRKAILLPEIYLKWKHWKPSSIDTITWGETCIKKGRFLTSNVTN